MLTEEEDKDKELQREAPTANASNMRSSISLATCKSTVSLATEKIKTASDVTKKYSTQFDMAIEDLHAIAPSIDAIEAQVSHLTNTCRDHAWI